MVCSSSQASFTRSTRRETRPGLSALFHGLQCLTGPLEPTQNIAVGYTGGQTQNPTYREVCSGTTGHAEALLVEYKPDMVKFEDLVHFFFKFHDPTTPNRQGNGAFGRQ